MRVELKNVSTYRLIELAKSRASFDLVYQEIYDWLIKNRVMDYQMLSDKLLNSYSGLSFMANSELRSKLENAKDKINNLESSNKLVELPIFTFDTYDRAKLDADTARITDENVLGTSLIYRSPTYAINGVTEQPLGMHSIVDVKHFLGHLTPPDLRNGLTILNTSFKLDKIKRFVGAVDFYEQQVVRQYIETKQLGVNVFKINYDKKYQLVSANLPYIMDYILMVSDNESVWCCMSKVQRDKLRQLGHSTGENGVNNQEKWLQLVREIANYSTLSELENDICSEQSIPIVTENGIEYIRDVPAKRFTKSLVRR